jgi:hydroxymethylbilane synthase
MLKIKIGTRASKLALIQTEIVIRHIIKFNPELSKDNFETVKITTTGDKILEISLSKIGGKALFTKEIEEALLDKRIDMAMHSMKDATSIEPKNLLYSCFLPRSDPRDALVSYKYRNFDDIKYNANIGTSSSRRAAFMLCYYPDVQITAIRGNVDTRLDKLKHGAADALLLAVAGLERLQIDKSLYTPIPIDIMLPSVAQGIIGVQCRADDSTINNILSKANDKKSELMAKAERAFLRTIGGDCSTPLGAYAEINDNKIKLSCAILRPNGTEIFSIDKEGDITEAEQIGIDAGIDILKKVDIKNLFNK